MIIFDSKYYSFDIFRKQLKKYACKIELVIKNKNKNILQTLLKNLVRKFLQKQKLVPEILVF